jgi:hypothetical protein
MMDLDKIKTNISFYFSLSRYAFKFQMAIKKKENLSLLLSRFLKLQVYTSAIPQISESHF